MCEFCAAGGKHIDRDSTNLIFSGFFTGDAIEIAVRKTTERRQANRRNRQVCIPVERLQAEDDFLRNRGAVSLALSDGSAAADDEDDDANEDDDDGT